MTDHEATDTVDLLQRLDTVLADVGELRSVEPLTGGFFATTYGVELVDGRRVVIKTGPADTSRLLTYEHDLIRAEALVYGLGTDRRDLLFPQLLTTDFSRTAFAGDVVVASRLDGLPWARAGFGSPVADPRARRAQRDLGALMARLHTVTGARFGYPMSETGLVGATWPEAFARIVEALLDDARRWEVEVPEDAIRNALATHADALAEVRTPVLVHHDLWPGNLFVDPDTGSLTGVIDPERALWGDPLLDLLGADQDGTDPLPPALLEGYAEQAGVPLNVSSADAVTRLRLYRVLWSLIWVVEATPRGYDGDFGDWHRQTARANLHDALDLLVGD